MASKQRLNILIVDWEEGNVAQLKDFLLAEGHEPHTLTDPEQIVAEVKKGSFQLVLLDVSPESNGLELLGRVRSADSDVCVIAMTALASVDVAVRSLKNQAFDYLQKPLDLEELQQVLGAAVREKGLLVDAETHLNQVIGRRLRGRRSAAELTLKQVANRTGLSVSLISQIELGKSAASISTLHKLATALQIKMTYFFETV